MIENLFAPKKRERFGRYQLDLVPMIDIVFQLILFFLVSTSLLQHRNLALDLAKSSSNRVSEFGIEIILKNSGAISINGREQGSVVSLQLREELSDFAKADANTRVNLLVERDVPFGHLVPLLDALREEGLTRVNLETQLK